MPFVTAIVVVVFGGLTLWLQDATFIKIKPTIIYLLFGGVLLGGLLFGKVAARLRLRRGVPPDRRGLAQAHRPLGRCSSSPLAILNEIVWRTLSTDTWVAFKVFGFLPLTFLFALSQVPLINKYTVPDEAARPRPSAADAAAPAPSPPPAGSRR